VRAQFHDALLANGTPPPAIVARRLVAASRGDPAALQGPTQTETFTASKRNLHGDLVTCGLDASETGQEEDLPRLCNGSSASSRRRPSRPRVAQSAEGVERLRPGTGGAFPFRALRRYPRGGADTRRAAAWQWSAVTAETARTSLRAHDMQMPRPYMAGTSLRHGPADNHGHEWIPAASSTPGLT
jgi:hypothetical protein